MTGGLGVSTRGLVHIYRSEGHDVAALSGVDLDVRGRRDGRPARARPGSGKSTLLTLFGGLMRPSAGQIRSASTSSSAIGRARRSTSSVRGDVGARPAGRRPQPAAVPAARRERRVRPARAPGAAGATDLPTPRRGARPGRACADHAETPLGDAHPRAAPAAGAGGRRRHAARACCWPTSRPASSTTGPATGARHPRRVNRTSARPSSSSPTTPRSPAGCRRTVTIRDGRIGGEGRERRGVRGRHRRRVLPLPAARARGPAARHPAAGAPRGRHLPPAARGGPMTTVLEPRTIAPDAATCTSRD